MEKKLCTIMTPTYNRGYIIKNLYNSLVNQSNKDFEWLVIDDGSTDNTESLIKELMTNDNGFEIRYYKKANEGKHVSINFALDIVNSDYFFIVDSDDYISDKAVEIINQMFNSIEQEGKSEEFIGVCGLRGYLNSNKIIGTTFDKGYVDCTYIERYKFNISGDKAEVYYTNILKKYRFPKFGNEKFLSEAVLWNQIASDGWKLRYFNEIIYLCEYLEDGLSKNNNYHLKNSPKGFAEYLKSVIKYENINPMMKYCYYGLFYNRIDSYTFEMTKNEFSISTIVLLFSILIYKVGYSIKTLLRLLRK